MPTWNNLNQAFGYLQNFIANKESANRFGLSEIDLALISNFKGGNASIAEPLESLTAKLKIYSQHLRRLSDLIKGRSLRDLNSEERRELGQQAKQFASLTAKNTDTSIVGFRASYASALLAAYFPKTVPVLDRLVLSETGIMHSPKQVADIEQYYPKLIEAFYMALVKEPRVTMRDLDKKWFEHNQIRRRKARKA
jgi:hypothetical protein